MSQWLDEEVRILRKYEKPNKTLNQVVDELKDKGFYRTKTAVELKLKRERIYKVPNQDTIGYFDIEATGLASDFDWMLCWWVKVADKDVYYNWSVTQADILHHSYDLKGCRQFLEVAEEFDTLKGYYSKWFDSAFIKSRCLYWLARGKLTLDDLKPISYGNIKHVDIWRIARNNINPHSRRMESLVKWLKVGEKTELDPEAWIYAQSGDKKSLAYVNEHCRKDVQTLETLTNLLKPFTQPKRESF